MIKGGRFNERSDDNVIDQGPLKESADNLTYEKDFKTEKDAKFAMKNDTSSYKGYGKQTLKTQK